MKRADVPFWLILVATILTILVIVLVAQGCASLPSQHQKIAAACEASASAADAIAEGVKAKRLTKAQGAQAERIYRKTVPFCEPPAESLGALDFAALLGASAELTAISEAKP